MKIMSMKFICAMTAVTIVSGSTFGQSKPKCANGGAFCPAVKGPYPKPQCTIWEYTDTKGDYWKHSCTNQAKTGDFVWEFDEAGAKGVKEIGRCVYFQGRNTPLVLVNKDNPKQFLGLLQVCQNSKNHSVSGNPPRKFSEPGNERTTHTFDKSRNKGVKVKETYNKQTGRWTETDRKEYESLTLAHDTGTIPLVPQEAEYVTGLRLVATGDAPGMRTVRWSAFEGIRDDPPYASPVLGLNDYVYVDGITTTSVVEFDSRFTLEDFDTGIKLIPTIPVLLESDDALATIQAQPSDDLYYAVSVDGSAEFLEAVMLGAIIELELADFPVYAATAGTLDLELGCCLLAPNTQVLSVNETYCVAKGGYWNPEPEPCPAPPPLASWNQAQAATRSVRPMVPSDPLQTEVAIEVRLLDLQAPTPANPPCCPPQDFSAYETLTCSAPGEAGACVRWIGPLQTVRENQDNPMMGTYRAARLQCEPYYHDFASEGLFTVVGPEVMPSSVYALRVFGGDCGGGEAICALTSGDTIVATRRSGDVASPFAPSGTQPDPSDVVAVLNKFRNQPGAPGKAIAQIQPNVIELNVDVGALDIVATIDAFRATAYPFSGPCPCPSSVTCNTTACGPPACAGGGLCVKTCIGGINTGQPCLNDTHCPLSTCGTGFCRDRCGRCRD